MKMNFCALYLARLSLADLELMLKFDLGFWSWAENRLLGDGHYYLQKMRDSCMCLQAMLGFRVDAVH